MYVIMDMGTTNTRLYMCANNKWSVTLRGTLGRALEKGMVAWNCVSGLEAC